MRLVIFQVRWRAIWHSVFGHGRSRIGDCGIRWDYEKHQPSGHFFYCYECGATFEKPFKA